MVLEPADPKRATPSPEPEGHSRLQMDNSLLEETCDRPNSQFFLERQLGMIGPNRRTLESREQYCHVAPNTTLFDVACNMTYPKRFSPCGKYMICFGIDRKSIQVFSVNYRCAGSQATRWEDMMQASHEVPLGIGVGGIWRDFCMFLGGPDPLMLVVSVVVGSEAEASVEELPYVYTVHSLDPISTLDRYTFWIVNYGTGKILHQVSFPMDYIILSNHSAVSLLGNRLSICSVQHQIIHLFDICEGKFVRRVPVGPGFGHDDPVWDSGLLVGIKQRMVAFLYHEALESDSPSDAIRQLHRTLHQIEHLSIWKAQLISADLLLVKLGPAEQLYSKSFDGPSFHNLALIDVHTGRVHAFVHDSEIADFYEVCKQYQSHFREPSLYEYDRYQPSWDNSLVDRRLHERTFDILASSKGITVPVAKRRLAAAIPYSSQSTPSPMSPFLNPELFRYDDRIVSPVDRVRVSSEDTCKFFSRRTGKICSRLSANPSPEHTSSRLKKSTHWVFHPYLPLIVSCQCGPGGSSVNIHYRAANCE